METPNPFETPFPAQRSGRAERTAGTFEESAGARALPVEYRYCTRFAGATFAGVLILVLVAVFGPGRLGGVFVAAGLGLCIYGFFGFFADPEGVWSSAGKRLVVTDECIQEVDEEWRVRWVVMPKDVRDVEKRMGRPVVPFGPGADWRVEIWEIVLKDGKRHRIPVWLLPERGRRFKERFETFLTFNRRAENPTGMPEG